MLLTGYATDMCFCRTTAGYENLSKDFNVFLVGDATLATFPANDTPAHATNAAISFAAIDQLITQVSWVKYRAGGEEAMNPTVTSPPLPGRGRRARAGTCASGARADAHTQAKALDRHHARPGDEPQLPDVGRHTLGLRKGQSRRRGPRTYAVEACRRVKAAGGVVHFFAVGRVLEQADVGWLKEIARARPSDRQPHLRPRLRAGDEAGGDSVPLPARAVADRRAALRSRSSSRTSA